MGCASALATMQELVLGGVIDNAARVGEYMYEKLVSLANKYTFVKDVRGMGLLLGMELSVKGKPFVEGCHAKGLLINCVNDYVLRFIPPLIVTTGDVDVAIDILDEVMAEYQAVQ